MAGALTGVQGWIRSNADLRLTRVSPRTLGHGVDLSTTIDRRDFGAKQSRRRRPGVTIDSR
jgi:hypothetical protein